MKNGGNKMEPLFVAIITIILAIIFWRFVLGIPLALAYRCPECGRLLIKSFTYRVERCLRCNKLIDWNQLLNKEE